MLTQLTDMFIVEIGLVWFYWILILVIICISKGDFPKVLSTRSGNLIKETMAHIVENNTNCHVKEELVTNIKKEFVMNIKDEFVTNIKQEFVEEEPVTASAVDCALAVNGTTEYNYATNSPLSESTETNLKHRAGSYYNALKLKPKITFTCDLCNKIYSTKGNLKKHMNSHSQQKLNACESGDSPYTCVVCDMRFSQKSNLCQHMSTHTKPRQYYACELCNKKYLKKKALFIHMRVHPGVRPYACHVCTQTFTTQSGLNYHKNNHTQLYSEVCDKKLCQKSIWSRNMRNHTTDECEEKFKDNTLMYHKKRTPGLYECDVCSKGFAQHTALILHKKMHTGEKSYYVCDLCNQICFYKEHLISHMEIHIGKKPIKCNICNKNFSLNTNMTRHKTCSKEWPLPKKCISTKHTEILPVEFKSSELRATSGPAPHENVPVRSPTTKCNLSTSINENKGADTHVKIEFVTNDEVLNTSEEQFVTIKEEFVMEPVVTTESPFSESIGPTKHEDNRSDTIKYNNTSNKPFLNVLQQLRALKKGNRK